MVFLFDTICDDIIGEITKYIVWTKFGSIPYHYESLRGYPWRVQRLLIFPLEKPIITLDCFGLRFNIFKGGWGNDYDIMNEILKNKIKKNKKGLITYTHQYGNFKQIQL